jgi:hypothetical protein
MAIIIQEKLHAIRCRADAGGCYVIAFWRATAARVGTDEAYSIRSTNNSPASPTEIGIHDYPALGYMSRGSREYSTALVNDTGPVGDG